MKKILLLLLIVVPVISYTQEKLIFEEVIDEGDTNKGELFIRGREWFDENFKSAKDVLQIQDKENGELSGKGIMSVEYEWRYMGKRKSFTDVSFRMNLWVKDGRYKYEMTDFYVMSDTRSIEFGNLTSSNETNVKFPGYNRKKLNEMYLSIKTGAIVKAKAMIGELKLKMDKKSKSSDW